jgi:hypothetical protein
MKTEVGHDAATLHPRNVHICAPPTIKIRAQHSKCLCARHVGGSHAENHREYFNPTVFRL